MAEEGSRKRERYLGFFTDSGNYRLKEKDDESYFPGVNFKNPLLKQRKIRFRLPEDKKILFTDSGNCRLKEEAYAPDLESYFPDADFKKPRLQKKDIKILVRDFHIGKGKSTAGDDARKSVVSEEEKNQVLKIQGMHLMREDHWCAEGYKYCNPDYKHWLITTRHPKEEELRSGGLPGFYLHLLSKLLNITTEDAKSRIYTIAGLYCPGFAMEGDREMVKKFENCRDILVSSRDCLWDRRFQDIKEVDKCSWDSKDVWGEDYDPRDTEDSDPSHTEDSDPSDTEDSDHPTLSLFYGKIKKAGPRKGSYNLAGGGGIGANAGGL